MNLSYLEVTEDNLKEVLAVVSKIFPEDKDDFVKHYNQYVKKDISDWKDVRYWKYFYVRNDKGEVVAITGLYNESDKHSEDEVWLGWYGVAPEYRGRGIGTEVLMWTVQKAKELEYKKFRLWTTTDNGEKEAQKLYEKVGLKIYDRKKHESGEYEILYRELDL